MVWIVQIIEGVWCGVLGGDSRQRNKVEGGATVRMQRGAGVKKGVVRIMCRGCGEQNFVYLTDQQAHQPPPLQVLLHELDLYLA